MENLSKISDERFQNFISSFDHIVSDIDGTLIYSDSPIPGADEFILKMRNLGKTVTFVTNNGLCSVEQTEMKLKPFSPKRREIITPFVSVYNYLKYIKFDKQLFTICGKAEKELYKEHGFSVVDFEDLSVRYSDSSYKEDLYKSSSRLKDNIEKIGAVIVSGGINSSWQMTQAAIDILNKNTNCLWICGTSDDAASLGQNLTLIGLKCIIDAIKLHTGRTPIELAKPGVSLKESIQFINQFKDSRRVLVIGDSISGDMGLGANCDFQKLLVLSGYAKKEDLQDWKYPINYQPEYYADSLGVLNFRLNKLIFQ